MTVNLELPVGQLTLDAAKKHDGACPDHRGCMYRSSQAQNHGDGFGGPPAGVAPLDRRRSRTSGTPGTTSEARGSMAWRQCHWRRRATMRRRPGVLRSASPAIKPQNIAEVHPGARDSVSSCGQVRVSRMVKSRERLSIGGACRAPCDRQSDANACRCLSVREDVLVAFAQRAESDRGRRRAPGDCHPAVTCREPLGRSLRAPATGHPLESGFRPSPLFEG